mmetsp:Transcript_29160/g.33360  ORF Transcript_29160/g.33360 Transcript_29160/m.33360 type:complete len:170 (-) Transcript_29160:5297-5806(-)
MDQLDQSFLLEQLTLEADLCYGRNAACKEYFRNFYPLEWLIDHIENTKINIELRGTFIRLMNYIYIDDPPHQLLKVSRAFKAYESCNQYIEHISSTRSDYLNNTNLNRIIKFILEYIQAFALNANGISYIKSFDMEFVRLINYLLKFGLFIYRNNSFQTEDVDTIFSFM